MTIFVYKVLNLVNGKFYIGVHEGELSDDYMGSGKAIRAAIKKHGVENFERQILKTFDCKEDAYAYEKEVVTPELIESRLCYNLNVGGKGGWYHVDHSGDNNPMKRPDVAAKVSASIKASMTDEERARRSERMKKMRADGTVTKPSGWKHSEEAKAKIKAKRALQTNTTKGLRYFDSDETKAKKKLAAQKRVAEGRDMGALTRGKKFNMKMVQCPHCGLEGKGGNMTRYHFDNCKKKESHEHC